MMDSIVDKLEPYYESATFPEWVLEKLRSLKINGLTIKGYGSPGLSTLEMGSIVFEIAKRDAGLASFMLVHNAIGMAVVNSLGDEEQKMRILTPAMNFEKILAFGLTEPLVGSDASNLTTTAEKVEGGYILNGAKRWIGNATFADVIIWARNKSDGDRVQGFLVEKGSPGFEATKMEGKWSLRMT
jgi:alkylation response protein AidB-like acyl-CoA dehydrogenase